MLFCVIPEVTSFECPDIIPCDCKRESHRSDNEVKVYNAVNCEGDMDIIHVNFSSLANNFIKTFIVRNSTKTLLTKDTFIDLQVDTVKIENTVIEIEKNTFQPLLESLRHLSLVNVKLNFSDITFIEGFSYLKSLVLDHNGEFPYHFPDNTFYNLSLSSLTILSLKYCGIAYIPNSSLAGLAALEVLDLSHNYIPRIPDAILTLKNLRKLFLSHNDKLTHIHNKAFIGLNKLQELDLSYTDIQIILPEAFTSLEKSLLSLKLNHCSLPDGHFNTMRELHTLRHLDISYNKIIEMHNTSFIGFDNLESLDISGQAEIRDGFVYHVIFTDSMFRGIEDTLRILRIKDLRLTTLPLAALSSFRNLDILDASNNDFSDEIDDGFFEGIRAGTVLLENCGISEISSEAFVTVPKGIRFNFDRNNITNISFILDTRLCHFSGLSFIDNPVLCDCNIVEIALTDHVNDLKGTCADPLYYGEKLKNLHKLAITRTMCGAAIFQKPKIDCSRVNTGTRVPHNHFTCSFSCFCTFIIFTYLFVL